MITFLTKIRSITKLFYIAVTGTRERFLTSSSSTIHGLLAHRGCWGQLTVSIWDTVSWNSCSVTSIIFAVYKPESWQLLKASQYWYCWQVEEQVVEDWQVRGPPKSSLQTVLSDIAVQSELWEQIAEYMCKNYPGWPALPIFTKLADVGSITELCWGTGSEAGCGWLAGLGATVNKLFTHCVTLMAVSIGVTEHW